MQSTQRYTGSVAFADGRQSPSVHFTVGRKSPTNPQDGYTKEMQSPSGDSVGREGTARGEYSAGEYEHANYRSMDSKASSRDYI